MAEDDLDSGDREGGRRSVEVLGEASRGSGDEGLKQVAEFGGGAELLG